MAECLEESRRLLIRKQFSPTKRKQGESMLKNAWILLIAAVFAAGCATQEEPKPAPQPAPQTPPPPPPPKPAPAPAAKEAPKPAPKPVAEKVTFAADVTFD